MSVTSLEDWVRSLLALSLEELERRYPWGDGADDAVEHLRGDYLTCAGVPREGQPALCTVPEAALLDLHAKVRGAGCEDGIWRAVIGALRHPLPPAIAHDLLDRSIMAWVALQHSRQVDEVQWRMAEELGGEALLTLARDLYEHEAYSLDEFRRLLERFPDDEWMLRSLRDYTSASSPEKGALFQEVLAAHVRRCPRCARDEQVRRLRRAYTQPDCTADEFRARLAALAVDVLALQALRELQVCATPEKEAAYHVAVRSLLWVPGFHDDYWVRRLTLMYKDPACGAEEFRVMLRWVRDREGVLERLDLCQASSPEKVAALREVIGDRPMSEQYRRREEIRRLEARAGNPAAGSEELAALHATGHPEVLRGLARNPSAPEAMLRALMEVRHVPHSRTIRRWAEENLAARGAPPGAPVGSAQRQE